MDTSAEDANFYAFVRKILTGHYKGMSTKEINTTMSLFKQWHNVQGNLFRNASKKLHRVRTRIIKSKQWWHFNPEMTSTIPATESTSGTTAFMRDIFTEPFPSTHDMDDWAVSCLITDIFSLNGISVEGSKKYRVHVKDHYVNHKMITGVIQVDIYKL